MDTIVAISTPSGSGGIAVIRLSGGDAINIAQKAWKGRSLCDCESHSAHLGRILDSNGETLDQAVATIFRAPNSFTGEDVVELSVHGSQWIQRHVVERLIELGARAAEGGEFSQRAFLNGKIDLAQAEGIADLIAASSRAAHRLAISQASGGFSRKLEELRSSLTDLASMLELELDFSEEDVEFADRTRLRQLALETLSTLHRLIKSYASGKAFKEGVPVAIAGRPNAGKSTLLNHLVDADKAIVSDIPGTTRDIIEETAEIDGILFRFYDTAGLRHSSDQIESIGIERARERIAGADIVVWMVDGAELSSLPNKESLKEMIGETLNEMQSSPQAAHIIFLNKTDLLNEKERKKTIEQIEESLQDLQIEGRTQDISDIEVLSGSISEGEGLELLERQLSKKAQRHHRADDQLILTNARHHAALQRGAEAIERAMEALDTGITADFIAQDVREALHHIGTVTGSITTSDLLSTIFSRFCIGK